ncbi:MAG: hypothetical protein ACTSQP_13480 [Promethearchaeota archaeon]
MFDKNNNSCGDKLVITLNSEGFQTDSYMVVGLSKITPEEGLIWRTHDTFTMREYENFAEEYGANHISELGYIPFRYNMGFMLRRKDFKLQGKMLWFFWQKCVKPTLDKFLQEKLDDVHFELTLEDLGSPIGFNDDRKYNDKDDIIQLDDSPFIQ